MDEISPQITQDTPVTLLTSLEANLQEIKSTLGNSDDIVFREFRLKQFDNREAAIVYTDGLADTKLISHLMESVLQSEVGERRNCTLETQQSPVDVMENFVLAIGELKHISDYQTLYASILSGITVILVNGYPIGLAASTQGWKDIGVTEGQREVVVRGSRESFSENIRNNTALIRRRIKDECLWLESIQIGRITKTSVSIMFIDGIAQQSVVDEVRQRLGKIDIDGILESGYIEEFIQDKPFSPFPTIYNSERPDVIAAELLEGKVAILVDGTPNVLVVPALFVSFLHSAEDYYQRSDSSSIVRILRYIGIFIALIGPSLYIAITTFHQEMLPTDLLVSLAAQREGVPFPAFVEAFIMEITFEILREAGLRMPRSIGQAVSIVGTLVIGQVAVQAGIVSSAMVIVVALTAICSFVFPAYNISISLRMLRFPLMALAGAFGLIGVFVGVAAIILHLCSLTSFGVPYLSPFAPFTRVDQKDAIIRLPHWALRTRPHLISKQNSNRLRNSPVRKP